MIRELNVDELLDALRALDKELSVGIEVRAVGGFALAWRKVREEGLTADIDSITDDYPESVMNAIAAVGERLGLGPWWLNNDAAAGDASYLIESMGLKWDRADAGLRNIDLYVADLQSLLKLKLCAVEDSALSGRARDLDDAIHLLVALGFDKIAFRKKMAYLQEDMPNAYRMVSNAVW